MRQFKLSMVFHRVATVFHKADEKKKKVRVVSRIILVATLILLPVVSTSQAQPGAGAYAVGRSVGSGWDPPIKGHRVYVWTGTPPSGLLWTVGSVYVCDQQVECLGKIVETGWIKGTAWDLGDVLQQYVTYREGDGSTHVVLHLGYLSENTWYQLKSMYSDSAARWEAWRFSDVVWYAPHDLGWTRGRWVQAGGENANSEGWIGAVGWHPEYRESPGSWTLYNYAYSDTSGGGHIRHYYDYGYHAWGP